MIVRSVIALALVALPAVAQEDTEPAAAVAPETSPPPEARPDDADAPAAREPGAEPGGPAFVAPGNEVAPVDAGPPMPDRIAADPEALAACLADLDRLGVTYEVAEPIVAEDDADCGVRNALRVTGLPDDVALDPAAHLRCDAARALAEWTEAHVIAAADRLPDRGRLVAIEQGGSYVCRRRNNRPEGELSEHAFGNAVDVMGFRFADGPPIPVQPREREGTMAEAFQDAVRSTACLYFTTVLGPGTDASHADHLHLDVADRRGDFRLCQ